MPTNTSDRVVVIDACRTPFARSGTAYREMMAWQLGSLAIKGIIARTGIPPQLIDHLIMGTVMVDVATTNIAREALLGAGLPHSITTNTCTAACVSANVAITTAHDMIVSGTADIIIAGGVESLSDLGIKVSKAYRRFLLDLKMFKRPKGLWGKLQLLKKMSIADLFNHEIPTISEYSTGLTMGDNADRLARRLGITRDEQDAYVLGSHLAAASAIKAGKLKREIIPVVVPKTGALVVADNGVRGNATPDSFKKLKPAFNRRYGSVTAGNSSFLTDGASAVLLMRESKAKALGLKPLAYIVAYAHVGTDPLEELLLGPAFATAKLLKKTGIPFAEIKVLEFHEAFAAQMLANIRYLESASICRERLGLENPLYPFPMERLNVDGGSLSLGHPFGATGGRLIAACCRRLQEEGAQFGLVAACGAGGIGNGIILENAQ